MFKEKFAMCRNTISEFKNLLMLKIVVFDFFQVDFELCVSGQKLQARLHTLVISM
jgi:hypothetical protein